MADEARRYGAQLVQLDEFAVGTVRWDAALSCSCAFPLGSHSHGILWALPPEHGVAAPQEWLDLQSATLHGLDLVTALGCFGICPRGTAETHHRCGRWTVGDRQVGFGRKPPQEQSWQRTTYNFSLFQMIQLGLRTILVMETHLSLFFK
jgi:hypothetical protein